MKLHNILQAISILCLHSGAVLAQDSQNRTELCFPQLLPCEGEGGCVLSRLNGGESAHPEGGSAAVCTCASTGSQSAKYCYTQRPTWSVSSQQQSKCKWGSGKPRGNGTKSDTLVTPTGCSMGIYVFCPDEGPVSGGTDVMIWGHGFSEDQNDMKVSFTGFRCDIIKSNSTYIHCLTTSIVGTNARGSYLRLRIELAKSGCRLEERSAFTYNHDPILTGMTPIRSFLGGGTNVTVTGNHLDSIANVMMQFTTLYKGTRIINASKCQPKNSTMVICPAPRLNLNPEDLQSNLQDPPSNPQQNPQGPQSNPNDVQPSLQDIQSTTNSTSNSSDPVRLRRNVPDAGLLQNPELVVYAGMKLDGVLSGQLYVEWKVYTNPIVVEFTQPVYKYRPTWPDYKEHIIIEGTNLLSGVTLTDYRVTIGPESCVELELDATAIRCTPPKNQPPVLPGALQREGYPALVVKVGNLEYVVGYIQYDVNLWNDSKARYAIIGGLAGGIPVLICIIILVVVRCHYKRKQQKKKKAAAFDDEDFFPTKTSYKGSQSSLAITSEKNQYLVGDYLHPKASLLQAVTPELRAQVQTTLIHAGRVDKTHIKVRGEHGAVYRGWLLDEKGSRMVSADVKTFKHDNVPFRDLKSFLQDAVKLKGFLDDNVQRLLAITISSNMPQVVVPSSEYGDLKSFLYKQRQRQEGQETTEDPKYFIFPHPEIQELTINQMVSFGRDISSGMAYLSEKAFVHEDLAARNCVYVLAPDLEQIVIQRLDKDFSVKVGDATLSRDIYELDYWRAGEKLELRPVKWMAPESLDSGEFSTKSDVWSFGVTLWEIFTLGMTPYTDIANADVKDHLKQGHRLSKPDCMPVSLYTDVTHCWAKEPTKRPTFESLHGGLRDFGMPSGAGKLNHGFTSASAIENGDIETARASTASGSNISNSAHRETEELETGSVDSNIRNSQTSNDGIHVNESVSGSSRRNSAISQDVGDGSIQDANDIKIEDGLNPIDDRPNITSDTNALF